MLQTGDEKAAELKATCASLQTFREADQIRADRAEEDAASARERTPRDAVEHRVETIPVPSAWAGPRDDAFALRVEGDSMMPTICPGDIVVVRPGLKPQNRQVVVARGLLRER